MEEDGAASMAFSIYAVSGGYPTGLRRISHSLKSKMLSQFESSSTAKQGGPLTIGESWEAYGLVEIFGYSRCYINMTGAEV